MKTATSACAPIQTEMDKYVCSSRNIWYPILPFRILASMTLLMIHIRDHAQETPEILR